MFCTSIYHSRTPIASPFYFTLSTNRRKAALPSSFRLNTPACSRTLANTAPISCRRISSTFSAVNVCRLAGVDCEQALHFAVDKFSARFAEFEKLAAAAGEKTEDMDPSRWDYYWMLAKNAVENNKN